MKKASFLVLLLVLLTLTSCNEKFNDNKYGRIKEYISGIYIEFLEVKKIHIDDANPKFYIDYQKNYMFETFRGDLGSSQNNIENVNKYVKDVDNVKIISAGVKLILPKTSTNKIIMKQIRQSLDGEFFIGELEKEIDLDQTKSFLFTNKFTVNKVKYQLDLIINFAIK